MVALRFVLTIVLHYFAYLLSLVVLFCTIQEVVMVVLYVLQVVNATYLAVNLKIIVVLILYTE